jgi:hypothetical protein
MPARGYSDQIAAKQQFDLSAHEETVMSNKSYCRFRSIVTDMSDCEDAIEKLFNGVTDDGQPLSDDEVPMYALRGGFLVRPLLISIALGAADFCCGAVLSSRRDHARR